MTKYNVGDRIEFDLDLGYGVESGTIKAVHIDSGGGADIEVIRDELDGEVWTIDESDVICKLTQGQVRNALGLTEEELINITVNIDDLIIEGDKDEVNKKLLLDNAKLFEDNDIMTKEIVHLKDRVRKLLEESEDITILKSQNDELRRDLNNSCLQVTDMFNKIRDLEYNGDKERLESRVYELLTANDQLEDEKGELQEEMEELNERNMRQMEESGSLLYDYQLLKQENEILMKVIRSIAGGKQ